MDVPGIIRGGGEQIFLGIFIKGQRPQRGLKGHSKNSFLKPKGSSPHAPLEDAYEHSYPFAGKNMEKQPKR